MPVDFFRFCRRVLLATLMFHSLADCWSSPRIQIHQNNISSVSDLWNIQIISDFTSSKIVNLRMMIYNNSALLLYEAYSDNFVLQTGVSVLNFNQRQAVRLKYSDGQLLSMSENEDLTVVISMFTPGSFTELAQTRKIVNMQKMQEPVNTDQGVGKPKSIEIGGTVEMTGLYNTRKDTLFYMPQDYFRLQTRHQISVKGLPFIYEMNVTTEQKYTDQNLNSYRFSFDYETFKQRLIARTRQKIETIEQSENINLFLNEENRLTKTAILDSLRDKKLLKKEYIDRYSEYIIIDSLKKRLEIYDEVKLKKTISKLNEIALRENLSNRLEEGKEKMKFNPIDTIKTKIDENKSHEDVGAFFIYNEYEKRSNTIADNSAHIRDTSYLLYKSAEEQYELLLTKYNNNKDSLDNFLRRLNKYSIQDLLLFSKLEDIVSDKILSYEKHYTKQEIEKLKEWDGDDMTQQGKQISDKYRLLERKERLLNSLKRFETGTVYPYYSNHTVNGVVLNGYNVNYVYKDAYLSFSGGKQLNVINDSINHFMDLKRPVLFAFALGYGSKTNKHIHLNYVYASRSFSGKVSEDKYKSVNHIVALDFSYRFFKDKWAVSGEFPISFISKKASEFNEKSKVGYAGEIIVNGMLGKNTDVELGNQYFSRNFQTYGVPFMYANYLNCYQKLSQKIGRYIKTELSYHYENFFQDEEVSQVSTVIQTLQSAIQIAYKKWNINMQYAPVFLQTRDATATKNFMHTSGIGLNSNYVLGGDKQLISSIGFNYNSFYNAQTFISDYGSVLLKNNVLEINKSSNLYLLEQFIFSDYSVGLNISLQKSNIVHTSNVNLITLGVNYSQSIKNDIKYTIVYQAIRDIGNSFRHSGQCQLNYRINKYLNVGTVLYYDNLDGVVEGNTYRKTNAFQVMTNLIFKI